MNSSGLRPSKRDGRLEEAYPDQMSKLPPDRNGLVQIRREALRIRYFVSCGR
jgi:hypothetical protein